METEITLGTVGRDKYGGRVLNPHTYLPISNYVPPYPYVSTPTPPYILIIIFVSITLYLNMYFYLDLGVDTRPDLQEGLCLRVQGFNLRIRDKSEYGNRYPSSGDGVR